MVDFFLEDPLGSLSLGGSQFLSKGDLLLISWFHVVLLDLFLLSWLWMLDVPLSIFMNRYISCPEVRLLHENSFPSLISALISLFYKNFASYKRKKGKRGKERSNNATLNFKSIANYPTAFLVLCAILCTILG